jgi:hypothetical protein
VGKAQNKGHNAVIFRQLGILPRLRIIPLLAEKLKRSGKLVLVRYH